MPELGEIITTPSLDKEFTAECPFEQKTEKGKPKKPENIADDDKDEVEGLQENDGGVLGQNLEAAAAGEGTEGLFPPTDFLFKQKANDTKRGTKRRIRLEEFKEAEAGDFPFTVAAHHLIPGNASLYKEDVKLINYMEDGQTVQTDGGKSYTIDGHIGYDVNGSHNGVWLPGNYAIKTARAQRKRKDGVVIPAREGTTPIAGKPWGKLYEEWQYQYVAGACKAGEGQFHDSHERPYSASVRKNLARIVVALGTHLDGPCPKCAKKKKTLPPPHRIKLRLYALSQALRGFVMGPPSAWKDPWFTSERWSEIIFDDGVMTDEFLAAYGDAKIVKG